MEEKKGLGIRDLPEGTLDTIVDAVTSEMPADAIIIFGSYARSEATEESDIDILVLTSLTRMEMIRPRTEAGLKMWGLGLPRDFLAMNTGAFEEALGWREEFAHNVVEDGIVIYGEFRQMRKLPQGDVEIDMQDDAAEAEEDEALFRVAQARLASTDVSNAIPADRVHESLGIALEADDLAFASVPSRQEASAALVASAEEALDEVEADLMAGRAKTYDSVAELLAAIDSELAEEDAAATSISSGDA